jgi:hypothetical protein
VGRCGVQAGSRTEGDWQAEWDGVVYRLGLALKAATVSSVKKHETPLTYHCSSSPIPGHRWAR